MGEQTKLSSAIFTHIVASYENNLPASYEINLPSIPPKTAFPVSLAVLWYYVTYMAELRCPILNQISSI